MGRRAPCSSTILAQLERFGLAGRNAPLLELRREEKNG